MKKNKFFIISAVLVVFVILFVFIKMNRKQYTYTTQLNCEITDKEIKCDCDIVVNNKHHYKYNLTIPDGNCKTCNDLCDDYAQKLVNK